MSNSDSKSYRRFTAKLEIDKSIHILEGLLKGIAIDDLLNEDEIRLIESWVEDCEELKYKHPYSEIVPALVDALKGRSFSEDSKESILFVCKNFTIDNIYFDSITTDMQKLQGIVSGIAADEIISEEELTQLEIWMSDRRDLEGCWPYDEIKGLAASVLQDRKIDKQEHDILLTFFNDFLTHYGHRVIKSPPLLTDGTIQGVCAVEPRIEFESRRFCFTGESTVAQRSEIAQYIREVGGIFSDNVLKNLDYLIIGANGNPCWAFSCYGRKIERAIELRKKGSKILIVHEVDFWKRYPNRLT